MLVLTRKLHESIVIDGNISVTVVSIRGNQVRLGITAPRSVAIYRAELTGQGGGDYAVETPTEEPRMAHAVN
jgi:carbon storage regulator